MNVKLTLVTPETVLEDYFSVQRQLKDLKKRETELRELLLKVQPGTYGAFEFKRTEYVQEHFGWKEAQKQISPEQLKVLMKFISYTECVRLKVEKR